MATIRQFIQTNPAKALELFGRLLETSDTAVKTRERLFGQLKDELELAASLEEQHLFPVLKKHKETKELVHEALSDNKQTRKLLTELEHTAKEVAVSKARALGQPSASDGGRNAAKMPRKT